MRKTNLIQIFTLMMNGKSTTIINENVSMVQQPKVKEIKKLINRHFTLIAGEEPGL